MPPCFRDEDLRADRQPEFTQIDLELSFETTKTLYTMIEGLMREIFQECLGVDVKTPFRQMAYAESMEKYGTDKPDLRFGMELTTIDDIAARSEFSVFKNQLEMDGTIKGICVPGGADISRKEIDGYTAFVSQFGIKGLAWMKRGPEGLTSSIVKFFSSALQKELIERFSMQEGDLLFFIADETGKVNQGLDHLRRHIAEKREMIQEGVYEFLWITDFPLFGWDAESGKLETMHHPFTAPLPEDIPLLETEPLKIRSESYDLVLNGYELGSGSQRIYSQDLQKKVFSALQISEEEIQERFGFFTEALGFGTPPTLGIGLGLDRIMMILAGTENIRDVIAFPKTQKASDLMSESPSQVEKKQLDELRIQDIPQPTT